MEFVWMFLVTLGIVFVVCGAAIGGNTVVQWALEKADPETQRGLLITLAMVIPVMLLAMVAGPFVTLWKGWRAFRSMPWK